MPLNADYIVRKNQADWDDYSRAYSAYNHAEEKLAALKENPSGAFEPRVRVLLDEAFPDMRGLRVCVPSSGDNMAVFSFALLGAEVTSCDISPAQLAAAEAAAARLGLTDRIRFLQADTMALTGVEDRAYDLVYTSNGVHVWISDLLAMYRAVHRILKAGGMTVLCDVHPFQRPFDSEFRAYKAYDLVGPFEDETTVTFTWRTQDIVNAMAEAGLVIRRMEELMPQKDYDKPFFFPHERLVRGERPTREEVDRMYDVRYNPVASLPQWLCIAAEKPEEDCP